MNRADGWDGRKMSFPTASRNERPVLAGFNMDDRGTEDAVKRDDACQVGAPQPPGITHPSFTVVAVKSLNGRIIIHG